MGWDGDEKVGAKGIDLIAGMANPASQDLESPGRYFANGGPLGQRVWDRPGPHRPH
jgi:hypothetical protein